MSKATIATVKSFVKKNYSDIYSRSTYRHNDNNGHYVDKDFIHNNHTDKNVKFNLGVANIWLVQGKNWVEPYSDDNYTGFRVSNCCDTFIVATKKSA